MRKRFETRHERFVRLAEARTNKLIKMIQLLGNLSGSNYESSTEEVNQIFTRLQQELDESKARFQEEKHARFSLDAYELPEELPENKIIVL